MHVKGDVVNRVNTPEGFGHGLDGEKGSFAIH
jgi:hypothetical protein